MTPEPHRLVHGYAVHMGTALALLPIGATLGYYALPPSLQAQLLVQCTPQLLSYLAMGIWASGTSEIAKHLGLERTKFINGMKWGLLTGLILGCLNTFMILSLYPSLGYDITFLKQTPHGRLPALLMVPWFICCIAFFVERGSPRSTAHSPCTAGNNAGVYIRPLHGEYLSASPLDCPVGRTCLGNDLAQDAQSLDHRRRPRRGGHHHV